MMRTLAGRYDLSELIASGGMGSVYLATDRRLGRNVAVKLLKDELSADPRFVERFKREAQAAAGLNHGNIARVFDYGIDDGCHFIVMEFAEGHDLARVLRDEGSLDPDRARSLAAQSAAALGHAHEIGLVHRDVKPANVLVDDADHVKVTDFGIARAIGASSLTATGSVLGTAQYLSPEQARGGEIAPATDVYALGIVLYEMLTGALPFSGGSAIEVAMRHVNDPVPPPSHLVPSVPAYLDRVVATATSKDPAARFSTGNEMRDALVDGAPATAVLPVAPPVTAPMVTRARDRWGLGRALLIVFASLLALAVVLAVLRITGPTDQTARQPGNGAAPAEEDEGSPEGTPPAAAAYVIPSTLDGVTPEDIERAVRESGLDITVERRSVDSPEPEGTLLATEPEPGSRVEAGGTITLIVSNGAGSDDDDEDDDDDEGPPGRGLGRDKGNRGQGKDDD